MAAAVENGTLNGAVHTNHDRDGSAPRMNGALTNGDDGGGSSSSSAEAAAARPTRMNDLPDEIQHITDNFVPLSFLLQRLAQKTHNNLQDVIRELARKPIAGSADGSVPSPAAGAEDGSIENIEKKRALLDFARSEHANWVKALVITEWSKKASQISKLIDLENHMFEEELLKYEQAVFTMLNMKRNLGAARLPSPDLKTALHVLSRGTASWMPDVGFIAPPPLTPQEQAKWLDDISTLLALRLNLEDHDTIPYHFRDSYTIASGRVTFKVPGEFEVDLTLASDDFSQQLWFLDLRFLFSPAPLDLTPGLRKALEDHINNVLAHEGLPGCYRVLHEYTLTHKINELRRQVQELARGRWIETIRVEQLNRAISVQYWTTRYANSGAGAGAVGGGGGGGAGASANQGLKSWFIIGVHSGHDAASVDLPEEQITSRLSLRWFRDNKEVKDDIGDSSISSMLTAVVAEGTTGTVSAEKILQTMTALHTEHVLSGIHAKLAARPLFAKRLATVRLRISKTDASESFLEVQLTSPGDRICVRIDPVTGMFSLSPQHSRIVTHTEMRINAGVGAGLLGGGMGGAANATTAGTKDPVEEGFAMLDSVRCLVAQEDLGRRAKSYGWTVVRNGGPGAPGHPPLPIVRSEELRQVVNLRDTYQVLWLKRQDWAPQWHVLASLSLSGDRWWLVKLSEQPPQQQQQRGGTPLGPTSGNNAAANLLRNNEGPRILMHMLLPMGSHPSDLDETFFSDLTIYATGILAQYTDTQELARRRKTAQATRISNPYLPVRAKMPALSIRLADLLTPANGDGAAVPVATSAIMGQPNSLLPTNNSSSVLARGISGGQFNVNTSTSTRRWWASDFVQLLFRGVDMEGSVGEKDAPGQSPSGVQQYRRRLNVLAEARLTVLDRAKFRLLGTSGRADHEVAFNAQTGQFCLYLRAEVGMSVIDTLVNHLRAIERLVGFLDAIRRQSRVIHTQTVTLSRLVFSYSVGPGMGPEETTTEGAVAAAAAVASCGRWRVTMDLSSNTQVRLQLERGCPHLRVADFLDRVANDGATFATVPFFLTATLSLHRALDRMEDAWEAINMRGTGMLGILPRALDWIVLRFMLMGPTGRPRQLVLDIRLRARRGEILWQIRRMDNPEQQQQQQQQGTGAVGGGGEDDMAKIIRRIFEGSGPGWRGLTSAAVASPYPEKNPDEAAATAAAAAAAARPVPGSSNNSNSSSSSSHGATGIEDCLMQIDESIRALQVMAMPPNLSMAQLQQRRAQAQAQKQAQAHAQAQTAHMG